MRAGLTVRTNMRARIWGAVAIVFVAALLVSLAPSSAPAAQQPVIDTSLPIDSSQCVPCHLDLGDVQVAGLKFGHGNHLLISCDGCHSRMPHREDGTERVPMEVCFACHGITHGDMGELATGACEDCHTPSFQLRPKSHGKQWAKKPHAQAADASGVNGCMMCHDAPKDCDVCHAKEVPGLGKMPDTYHSLITPRPKGPAIKIFPKGPVSMSQCVYCHTDVDDVTPGRLIFAHAEHLQRNYRCVACHPKFAHDESGITRPDMRSCYRCHGLNHNSNGQVATEKCDACHPKEFDLKPGDHTAKFAKGAHRKRAGSDPAYCAMCHASSFCVGCHQGKKVSAASTGKPVIPADHRKGNWNSKHGGIFLDGSGACGACHDDQSCKRCHKTVMPHPVGWIGNHAPEPGVDAEDCKVCHADRSKCQDCHHKDTKSNELIASNCVGCHDEMKLKPATRIKHKGFAEHAVHFNVAVRSSVPGGKPKSRPYRCDDCHLGFGTLSAKQNHAGSNGLASASHDVKLCYGCHGSLDYKNQLIAPYPGPKLCLRCHTDLNV